MRASSCYYIIFAVWASGMLCSSNAMAQIQQPPGAAPTLNNIPQRDTSLNKTNNTDWKNENVRLTFSRAYSDIAFVPDTSLRTFHRRPFVQPWHRTLGNHGSAAYNGLFTPEYRVGPTSGYHVFDIYRYNADSLYYYNTNRPYSFFQYQLGPKLEQTAHILHTQNVRPNWNIAFEYHKIMSPGNFLLQRILHDNANLTTNYQSPRQRYKLYGAIVYNNMQQDENGGIVNENQLDSNQLYGDRRTLPVRFGNTVFANEGDYQRSAVSNTMRDASLLLQHSYTFGRIDTLYSDDSTRYSYQLNPRFGISHRLQISNERHRYKDVRSDSARYAQFFNRTLRSDGQDSVVSEQRWKRIDNRVMLNSFIGKRENLLSFSAGLGNRVDHFNTHFATGNRSNDILSNYLIGELNKEIHLAGQWFYNADAQIYLTGEAAGNSSLRAEAGKDLGPVLGQFKVGFQQRINNAPYAYTIYQNQYDTIQASFNKESVSLVSATYANYRLKLNGGLRNYVIGNYIYLDQKQMPAQYGPAFNITQVWVQKLLTWKRFVLDNELVYQQKSGEAPINIPTIMGRHQLCIESPLFKSALIVATGVEVRYHSNFKGAGYSPFFNRFYYQDTDTLRNPLETSIFFNFRVKRFRAYIMGDQLQKLWANKNVIATPGYPMPDFSIRFGFTWTLIN
ncbi:MAG: hypothetical protein EOP56_04420 [Sphingobacteriales bacterium]|nr:MAG: hypothetical protein EOP56_04420 [Sphingobacteriales bacterium]